MAEAGGRFTRGLEFRGLTIRRGEGTSLEIERAMVTLADPRLWWGSPGRPVASVVVDGVHGTVSWESTEEVPPARPAAISASFAIGWPAVMEIGNVNVRIVGESWSVGVSEGRLVLDEGRTGTLEIGVLEMEMGGWRKILEDIRAVTAWRAGRVYLAELAMGPDVTIDQLSFAPVRGTTVALEARAFGGYVYADWTPDGGAGTVAALNAFDLSLDRVGAFAGSEHGVEGRLDVAKLTFNGDPARPWSGQISLRLEAGGMMWRNKAFEQLTLGLSVAGRRVRVNEGLLRQKKNTVSLRGTVTLPAENDASAWWQVPFDFDVAADVRDLHALGSLFGEPWSGLSGGLTVGGRGSGQAADGEGWLKVRGWDLRVRGVPASSLQADLSLEGRDLRLVSLDMQSGRDFARGFGRLSLGDAIGYQGRLELRLREVARYLEPLGRHAPDWAREGGVLLFWDGDGTAHAHSGVATVELVKFTGDLNPVPVNAKLDASYSPGNIYVSRFLLDRGPLSLSSTLYFGAKGLSVQGIQMFSGRTRLLNGELFLPLSLDAVLARKPWTETILPDGGVYAYLRSDDLDLGAVVQLFGQDTAVRGRVDLRLDAQGPWGGTELDGTLVVTGLQAEVPSLRIPSSRLDAKLRLEARTAEITAEWQPRGGEALRARASVPMFGELADGRWSLFNAGEPWEAEVEIPPTDVATFAAPGDGVRVTAGMVEGAVRAAHTTAQPHLEGELTWTGGRIELPQGWQPVEDLEARVLFRETRATFEGAAARMGEGGLEISGSADFADRRNVGWEFGIRGKDLLFRETDPLRLAGTLELKGRGNRSDGAVTGLLMLDGSAVTEDILVTPQIGEVASSPVEPPFRLTADSWDGWALDVALRADEPLRAGTDGGLLRPELVLRGTLGAPLLLGTLQVERAPVTFPAKGSWMMSGNVHFTRAHPWMPVLDLTGTGEVGPYDLRAGAFGPLNQRRLYVTSAPLLTPEQIALMLATGVSPVPAPAEIAPLTPEEKLRSEPGWSGLDRIRGLLGWGTTDEPVDQDEPWRLGVDVIHYEWAWQ